MKGRKITVKGDVDSFCGIAKKDGEITVNGNAKNHVTVHTVETGVECVVVLSGSKAMQTMISALQFMVRLSSLKALKEMHSFMS